MKSKSALAMIVCGIAISAFSQTQKSVSPVTQVLQSSLTAMLGKATVTDITLIGTAQTTTGSEPETGPFSFKATASGASRIDVTEESGVRTEIRVPSSQAMSGTWSQGGGNPHQMASHNLLSGANWPFPAYVLTTLLQNSSMAVLYAGQESSGLHFWACEQPPGASKGMLASLQHLTRMDIWLDPNTFLPTKLSFNMHPDNNAAIDIPVAVSYSGYQALGGIITPSHVQQFFSGTPLYDVHIQSASVNSGLPPSDFPISN